MNQATSKASWYRHRLSSMSVPEVFHRLGEAVKRRTDILQPTPIPQDFGTISAIPEFRDRLEKTNLPTELLTAWKQEFIQAQNGEFYLLNQKWPKTLRDQRWYRDPVTGKLWPREPYGFQINYRHNPAMGDVKYVWELNRLQYLQHIAVYAFKTKSTDAAHFCLDEMDNWVDNNRPNRGINWTSGNEIALRIISFLVVASFVGEHMSQSQRAKLWSSLQTHALWLERYPSKFSSANNHRAAEGLALFLIGCLCPRLPRAEEWKNSGWDILNEAAAQLILPDGTGAEQALSYTAITLEMLLLGHHVARFCAVNVSNKYIERIVRGGEFLRWMTDAGGNQPHIGDDDNACILGAYSRKGNYVSSVLGCVAAIGHRGDLVPPELQPSLRQILLCDLPEQLPGPRGYKCFADGGYSVGRHRMNGHDIMLAFDHGPLGYLSTAAHGHADALSIWLHIDDQPVFVDAGTYLYHTGDQMRDYFRGTAVHNTLNLGGHSASQTAAAFNWSRKASVSLLTSIATANGWLAEAEQDGYLGRFGVLHRRQVEVNIKKDFTITDQLVNFGSEDVELNFLLHPLLSAETDSDNVLIYKGKKLLLKIENQGVLKPKIIPPGLSESGWYSPRFGEKQQTTRITFTGILTSWKKSVLSFTISDAKK